MRCLKPFLGFVLLIILILSCTNDEEFTKLEVRSNDQFVVSSEVSSISPSLETINSIKQEIINSTILKTEYDSLSNLHGRFYWNKATYQPAENSRSITCIPSEKDNQLTGMIVVFDHDDHMDFSFINLSQVMTIIQNYEDVDELEFIATIFSLQNMLYYRYRYINQDLNTYILEYLDTHQIGFRNVAYAVEWVVTIEVDGKIVHSYTDRTWRIRPCGGGGFGGPIFTNANPNSNSGFTPASVDSTRWNIRTLVINDDEEDIEDITECADHSICNDLFNHINNISGNYTVGNCSNVTASELALDILTQLCDNNIGDNTGISIEGNGSAPNIICDKDKFDEMWEEAVKELEINLEDYIVIDPSFKNCAAYNCVLEHLTSTSNPKYCDMIGQLFDSENYTIIFESGYVAGDASARISDLENKEISIKVHYADCNLSEVDQLKLAETLLHESQHANFYAELIELGLEENTDQAIKAKWLEYAQENFNVPYANDHQWMVKHYMQSAAQYLWELNGKELTPDHYKKYVWDGLSYILKDAFPQSTIDSWEDKYKELNGITPYSINKNYFSCQ